MRRFLLVFPLLCGCPTDDTDTDPGFDTDTDGTDTDTDPGTDADTTTANCTFSDLLQYSISGSAPNPGDGMTLRETIDVCFGGELEGRWVRQYVDTNNALLCSVTVEVSSDTPLASGELCTNCEAGFDGVAFSAATLEGSFCGALYLGSSWEPWYCGPSGTLDVLELHASANTLYRNGPSAPVAVPGGDATYTLSGDTLADGMTAVRVSVGSVPNDPPECRQGAGR